MNAHSWHQKWWLRCQYTTYISVIRKLILIHAPFIQGHKHVDVTVDIHNSNRKLQVLRYNVADVNLRVKQCQCVDGNCSLSKSRWSAASFPYTQNTDPMLCDTFAQSIYAHHHLHIIQITDECVNVHMTNWLSASVVYCATSKQTSSSPMAETVGCMWF